MKFMLQYPDAHGPGVDLLDAGPVGELALAAERAGWAGMSFTEHPAPGARWLEAGGHQTLDPFVALGAVAAMTSTIRLLTYLAVVPYRNPLLLAKAATTVDKISNGRFTLGAGTGYLKGEFRALGVDFEQRNELFDEALDVLALHWKGEPFSYDGIHFVARDVVALPRPAQDQIPIWIGGNSKLTLRRVAERAQGWMPLLAPAEMAATTRTHHLESLSSIADRLELLRDLAGDRYASIDVAVPYVGRDDDPTGGVEQRRDHFGRLAELGVTWIIVAPPWAVYPAALDYIDGFAAAHF
ncbi:MAG TPA: LLM class F420-dependent oxidoreductase [Ilumatobacteraceae bacterium]|nr:LLM class F420-dependent oxidoreductase [Ilumatobacteraceae bacterium]